LAAIGAALILLIIAILVIEGPRLGSRRRSRRRW
jgi:hypothetical protein